MPDLDSGAVERPHFVIDNAKTLIREANRVRDGGYNETVTRQVLVGGFADTFPATERPWWVERHIKGAEQQVNFDEGGVTRRGFVDSVVGLTAIEYEYDLRDLSRFTKGKHQVRQYCAGLLNEGAESIRIRGVLSDGVDWYAYELAPVEPRLQGLFSVEDVNLIQLESLSCNTPDDRNAEQWIDFLVRHLGREGTRPLTARSVADYLGFESGYGTAHLAAFENTIRQAMAEDESTANLVQNIWTSFVSYLSTDCDSGNFDTATYIQEFYLTVLARLMCANVIIRRALRSDDRELTRILDGRHFEAKGLHRFVEHDYFGWLTSPTHVEQFLPLAAALQADLAAFDFATSPDEDIFGELLAMLAKRTQRLLLGQEWTPAWLANLLADRMFETLPESTPPHFVDMCCGSGAMMVAVSRLARKRLECGELTPGSKEAIDFLVQAATGFDIDPLAVVLAKVNWVVTNRDWLEPFDGSHSVSLPVYNADSLFALAPIFDNESDASEASKDYTLRLLDHSLTLPRFLVAPATQSLFDELLERVYSLAMHHASESTDPVDPAVVADLLRDAVGATATELAREEYGRASTFVLSLVRSLVDLQRNGQNGIWVFVILNSYRPGLVAGQFNGIISNPPWLALSKIGRNPFGSVLRERAKRYGLTPQGSAFPHSEMATTFLAHSIDHFLEEDGRVACILPDTIRNGSQHDPFRAQVGGREGVDIRFDLVLDELWQVDSGVFRNRAAVVIGRKSVPEPVQQINGYLVAPGGSRAITHYPAAFGSRFVWSPNPPGDGVPGGYPGGFASQGADVMPRRLVMVSSTTVERQLSTISTPRRDGDEWYLLSDAKKHLQFSMTPRTLPDRFIHTCLISKHLGPFVLTHPATVVLPIARNRGNSWRQMTGDEIAASPAARGHFDDILEESDFDSPEGFWESGLNYRHKLTDQVFPPGSWLVVYGAGGGIPAAAHAQVCTFGNEPPVIDQTLYWVVTDDEDEALFLVGVINSGVLLERIADFIPQGDFGDRHLHTLPSMAVPQFDPAHDAHVCVVTSTRTMLAELHQHCDGPGTQNLFTTEVSMTVRRRRLRELIRSLESYDGYVASCRNLYDSVTPV